MNDLNEKQEDKRRATITTQSVQMNSQTMEVFAAADLAAIKMENRDWVCEFGELN